MNELTIETRRRSRSKTPFLRSSCDHESCEHIIDDVSHVHHNRRITTTTATTVTTTAMATATNTTMSIVPSILEETVEVTSSSSSTGSNKEASNKMMQTKIKTSDYSSDDSAESRIKTASNPLLMGVQHEQRVQTNYNEIETIKMPTSSSTSTTSSTIIVRPNKAKVRYGYFATSTPKSHYNNTMENVSDEFANHNYYNNNNNNKQKADYRTTGERHNYTEITKNILNRQRHSVNNNNNGTMNNRLSCGFLGYSLDNKKDTNFVDNGEHLAYLEYKEAGEYWNKTPKTDYTYSELSKYRRMLAPGVVAMPNMSRCSLLNHHQRIDYMVERQPSHESYIRKRYAYANQPQEKQQSLYQQHQKPFNLTYDSGDDELDLNENSSYRTKNYRSNYNRNLTYYPQHWKSRIARFITAIIDTASHAWFSMLNVNSLDSGFGLNSYNKSSHYARKRIKKRKGFLNYIAWPFMFIYHCISLLITSVLYFDTWLLQSSKPNSKGRKRFFLSLLILLPLLLFAVYGDKGRLSTEKQQLLTQDDQQKLPFIFNFDYLKAIPGTICKTWYYLWPFTFIMPTATTEKSSSQVLKATLTANEYDNLLSHINNYVQQLVTINVQQQLQQSQRQQQQQHQKHSKQEGHDLASEYPLKSLTLQQQTELIVQIVEEYLEKFQQQQQQQKKSLDLDNLMEIILKKLETSDVIQQTKALQLVLNEKYNNENIKNLIQSELMHQLNVKAIMEQLLESQLFKQHINERMKSNQQIIDRNANDKLQYLQQQLDLIKLSINNNDHIKNDENNRIKIILNKLQETQNDLIGRLQQEAKATDERFAKIMEDIFAKLATHKNEQFSLINHQIKINLIKMFGLMKSKGNTDNTTINELTNEHLQEWLHQLFVAKDYLEQRLLQFANQANKQLQQEINHSSAVLMHDISEKLQQEIFKVLEQKQSENGNEKNVLGGASQLKSAITEDTVKNIVKSVLAIYDADKTGLVDFALESAGGQILSTRCTESYQSKSAQISIFGIPLWYPTNTPRIAISPNVQPGECWAFQGFPGFLVLKLNSMIYVTGFTMEHIPKALAPNGRIDSAPKNFTVWGLQNEKDHEPVLFGEYEFKDDNMASLQYFPVQNINIERAFQIVELRIESNHGHPLYTCLYRFRVHGKSTEIP